MTLDRVKEEQQFFNQNGRFKTKLIHEIDTGEYKIVIDGVEVNIPEEEDIIASLEEEAAKLEVTVDYYMQEFL